MKLSEIKNELKKMLMQFSVVKTDKAVLQYDAEELAVGVKVMVETEDGETVVPEDGSYVMEDGRTLVIEGGEIKEIKEAPEVVEEEAPEVVEEVEEMEVVEEVTPEEITDEPIEEETPSELENKVLALEEKVAELESKVAELVSGLEKMSLAKPASEEFENVKTVKKTGFDKVDKFLEKYGNK